MKSGKTYSNKNRMMAVMAGMYRCRCNLNSHEHHRSCHEMRYVYTYIYLFIHIYIYDPGMLPPQLVWSPLLSVDPMVVVVLLCWRLSPAPWHHAVLVILSPPLGPCGSGGPVHVVLLLPPADPVVVVLLCWWFSPPCVRNNLCVTVLSLVQTARRSGVVFLHSGTEVLVVPTLTTTLSIGHHALVVGHVTPCGTYAVLVTPPVVLVILSMWFWWYIRKVWAFVDDPAS